MTQDEETSERGCLAWLGGCATWGAVVVVLLIGGACLGGYFHYHRTMERLVLTDGETASVHIEQGAGWDDIVSTLETSGLVEVRPYFEIWARTRGLPQAVKAGRYQFEGPLESDDLAQKLREGTAARDVEVTIPEGWTIFEIADRLQARDILERDAFLEMARDSTLLAEFDLGDHDSFEGYLFPETYRFRPDADAEAIIRRMHRRWQETWHDIAPQHASSMSALRQSYEFERHDLVTIASIVQAETNLDEERPIVARVVLNRLDASMRLQMDPTCVYGPDHYDEVPTPELCDDASHAYSTYAHDGLPPGPIGNPGRASLSAALEPADDSEAKSYLYYVARQDGTGRHVFSKTYREHRRAVDTYLK